MRALFSFFSPSPLFVSAFSIFLFYTSQWEGGEGARLPCLLDPPLWYRPYT